MLEETYKSTGFSYKVTEEDVRSYMRIVDTNSDGQISFEEFEQIVLLSLQRAGIEIY